jgi:cation transport ATPase
MLSGQVWWCTPLIPALGRQRQADFWVQGQPRLQSEFQDSQGYTEKPCLEKAKIKIKIKKKRRGEERRGEERRGEERREEKRREEKRKEKKRKEKKRKEKKRKEKKRKEKKRKMLSIFHWMVLATLKKDEVTIGVWFHFCVFNSTTLIYWSVIVPIPNSFYHNCSVVIMDGDSLRSSFTIESSFRYPRFFFIPHEFANFSF